MTDIAATSAAATPLQITIHPPSQGAFLSGQDNTPSFKDVLDIINPLQHIPGISLAYQALTGDIPAAGAKIAGDALFGGPIGLFASIIDQAVQSATGATIGGNIVAAVEGKPIAAMQTSEVQVAANTPRDGLSPNQRANYNAYVQASQLA